MTTTPRRKADSDLVTVEEFFYLVPDGQKADLDRWGDLYGLT